MPRDPPRPQDAPPNPPPGESEDMVDLNLDESLDGDLQAVADEVASEYRTQAITGTEDSDVLPPGVGGKVDLETALVEAEHQMEELLRREAELMDHQRRLAADFNNFRNRAQRDIALAV